MESRARELGKQSEFVWSSKNGERCICGAVWCLMRVCVCCCVLLLALVLFTLHNYVF